MLSRNSIYLAKETLMNSDENMAPSPVQPLSGQGVLRISRSVNRFIGTKTVIKFGNWNVRTLRQEGINEELGSIFNDTI